MFFMKNEITNKFLISPLTNAEMVAINGGGSPAYNLGASIGALCGFFAGGACSFIISLFD